MYAPPFALIAAVAFLTLKPLDKISKLLTLEDASALESFGYSGVDMTLYVSLATSQTRQSPVVSVRLTMT